MAFKINGFDETQAAADDEFAYNCREDDEPATVETVKAEPPTTADRIAEAEKFFNLLFGNVTSKHFGYLWTKQGDDKNTCPFDVSTADNRKKMAALAIKLNDKGADVYIGVNLGDKLPAPKCRFTKEQVTLQTATITDIDIEGGTHISNEEKIYPPTFDVAKSFLPFDASFLVNSGYGLHGYCLYREPVIITADNRDEAKTRNEKFIAEVRRKAGRYSKAVDGVSDLPRVMRVPGTRNYKLGVSNDAPLCHVVEVNDIQFTPADIDEKLAALKPTDENLFDEKKSARADVQKKSLNDTPSTLDDDDDYKKFRIRKMLDCISVVDGEYEKWLNVGMGLFNEGMSCSDWEQWSRTQPEFKEGECESKWRSFHNDSGGITIATLHEYAKAGGYDEKSTKREWYQLHPELSTRPQKHKDTQAEPVQDVKKNSVDTSATTGDAELDELLAVYRNTYDAPIDPKIISELKTAKEFVDNFKPENITAADVASLKTRRLIALLTVYAPSLAKKYYLTLRGLRDVSASAEEKKIKPLVAIVKGAQKKYQQKCADAARQARQDEKAFVQSKLIQRLKELREKPQSPERDAEIISLIRDTCEWKMNIHGDRVAVKATQANADLIFTYDPAIDGLFAFDEFQARDVFKKAPPWDKTVTDGAEWRDLDEAHLQRYLRATYTEFASKDLVYTNTVAYSYMRKFHKIKDFFKNLPKWDGVKRAETLFVKFLSADDTSYVREVTLNWLTAAVARIFHPGCDYQLAPIILGPQGIGKTTLINALGGAWYGSLTSSVDDPHAVDDIQPLWIVEIKEMVSLKKDVDANKRFIDAKADDRRAPYERRSRKTPRHVVFIVTTNNPQCLVDRTGNRRYPVIKCNSKQGEYIEIPDGYIQQVWAEVFAHFNELFADGFDEKKLVLSKAAQKESNDHAEEHLRDDGIDGEIAASLDVKILPPVIWNLLTREEHRKFIAEGKITIAEHDITRRFKNSRKRIPADLQDEFDKAKEEGNAVVIGYAKEPKTNITIPILTFYGTEYRQHTCAAEIFNECFGTDRRKSMPRIYESLNRLAGWHLGARIKNYPCYGDQKNVYYRDADNFPADDEPENKIAEPTVPTSFSGTMIDPDDTPF